MKKLLQLGMVLGLAGLLARPAYGVVIDFAGGTAYFVGGGSAVVTDAGSYFSNVDYYIEDGIKVDFVGAAGIVGNYYGTGFSRPTPLTNSVIHVHWDAGVSSVLFTKVDGSTMDVNYLDLTSNTVVGGGLASGHEHSYITPIAGSSVLLPSSDWGFDYISTGAPGDGVERLYLSSAFDGILGFSVTSSDAYCFGMDNFYIDEPAPPGVPDSGSTVALLGLALAGMAYASKRRQIA